MLLHQDCRFIISKYCHVQYISRYYFWHVTFRIVFSLQQNVNFSSISLKNRQTQYFELDVKLHQTRHFKFRVCVKLVIWISSFNQTRNLDPKLEIHTPKLVFSASNSKFSAPNLKFGPPKLEIWTTIILNVIVKLEKIRPTLEIRTPNTRNLDPKLENVWVWIPSLDQTSNSNVKFDSNSKF